MRNSELSMGAILLLLVLVVTLIVVSPLVSIWAVNILFGTNIAYTLSTWAAAAWLTLFVTGSAVNRGNRSKT